MPNNLDNWRTQVKKGYLELCLLLVIHKHKSLYGLELLEKLDDLDLSLKEGTLYPLLNRMTEDGTLSAKWESANPRGRKFYALTKKGVVRLSRMEKEFAKMTDRIQEVKSP